MIERMEISGVHYKLNDDIKKYVEKKIGRLDRFVPAAMRDAVHVEVKLDEKRKGADKFMCEVVLHLPHDIITVKETTINIFAAVDIVEAKLKNQLKKYKEKNTSHTADRKKTFSRLRKLADRDYWGKQN